MRASEVTVIVSAYVRQLGYSAVAHTPQVSEISLPLLAVQAGLMRFSNGKLTAPFIGPRVALGALPTDLALAPDPPLGRRRLFDGGAVWWLGIGGTETRWDRWLR